MVGVGVKRTGKGQCIATMELGEIIYYDDNSKAFDVSY